MSCFARGRTGTKKHPQRGVFFIKIAVGHSAEENKTKCLVLREVEPAQKNTHKEVFFYLNCRWPLCRGKQD